MNQIIKRFRMRDIILILVFSLGLGMAVSITRGLHYAGFWSGPGQNYLSIGGQTSLIGLLLAIPVFLFVCLLILLLDRVSFRAPASLEGKLSGTRLFFLVWAVLLISWTPYLLTYYPGGVVGDGAQTLEYAINTDQITSHWGVTQIMVFRLFLAIGRIFSSDVNLGIYLYAVTSAILYSGACAAVITTLRSKGVPFILLVLFTLLYAYFGHYASFSMCLWKDGLFGAGIVAFTLLLWVEPDGEAPKTRWAVKSGLVILFICFWRNFVSYGLLAFGLLWLAFGKNKKRLIAILMVLISLFSIIIQGPVYQLIGIQGRSITETLAIPLQQVAAVVNAGMPLSEDQERVLFAILPGDVWSQSYSPAISDSIKRDIPGEYMKAHLADFLRVWLELLVRYPHLYLKAHLMETLGFWQPYGSNRGAYFDWYLGVEDLHGRGYKQRDLFAELTDRSVQNGLNARMDFIPSGTLVWILLLCSLLLLCRKNGRGEGMRIILPYLCCWLVVVFSAPIAYSFRYIEMLAIGLPVFSMLPFVREETTASEPENPDKAPKKGHTGIWKESLAIASCAVVVVGLLLFSMETLYSYKDGVMEIVMAGGNENVVHYVSEGLSVPENDFRWTLGEKMNVKYPNWSHVQKLDVEVYVKATFNGGQRYQVLDPAGVEVASGVQDGAGIIHFQLYPDYDEVEFSMLFPDAVAISDVISESGDNRVVAMQISKIALIIEPEVYTPFSQEYD